MNQDQCRKICIDEHKGRMERCERRTGHNRSLFEKCKETATDDTRECYNVC